MSDVLWFNGRFTTTDEPVLTVQDRGLLFGDAVYEVMKFVGGAPILAAAHWRRLCRSLAMLEIRNPWTAEEFAFVLGELLARTDCPDGVVYLQVSRGAGPRSHAWPPDLVPVAFMYSSPFRFPDETMRGSGVSVITLPESRWSRCEIKSVNLLPNVIAKTSARRGGAYESIFVDEGRIVEGSSSNFFAVLDGVVVTREHGTDLLPGTVRDVAIALVRAEGLEVSERSIALSDLARASEAFLTSTTSAILPVTSVDGRQIAGGLRGEVTSRLQDAFARVEREECEKWRNGDRGL